MPLGSNVKKFREAAGLTQRQLGDRVGMDPQAIGALERRDSKSSSFASALAAALGKPVGELLGEGEDAEGLKIPAHFVDSDEILKLIDLYRRSTPKGREQIMLSADMSPKIVGAKAEGGATND